MRNEGAAGAGRRGWPSWQGQGNEEEELEIKSGEEPGSGLTTAEGGSAGSIVGMVDSLPDSVERGRGTAGGAIAATESVDTLGSHSSVQRGRSITSIAALLRPVNNPYQQHHICRA